MFSSDFDHGLGMHDSSIGLYVRKNACAGGTVQELRLPPGSKISDLLEKAGKALGLECPQRAFHSNGVECTDVENIDENEVLHISSGEPFRAESQGAGGSQIVGDYLVQDKLGQGGFGSVFKGVHLETGEACAVKFVPKKSFSQISDLQRVFQEIQSLRNLRHPNIIRILGMADHPESVCFFMEFAAGGELKKYVEAQSFLSEEETRHFFKQIVRAVHYIHSKKIIHRDLKLENILLDASLRCKIVDFGLSGYVAPHERTITDAGTEAYLAPEVYSGCSGETDPYKLDVWALGVILFALHHGKLPFSRPDKETCDRLDREVLPSFKEDVSSGYKRLVKVTLTPKPAKRASVDEITLDSWTTNNRFDLGLLGDESGEEDATAPVEEQEAATGGDAVAEGPTCPSPSATPEVPASSPAQRTRRPRPRDLATSSPSPPTVRATRSCPGEQDGPSMPRVAEEEQNPSPRGRGRRQRGGPPGSEKAMLIAAGAQVVGQRHSSASGPGAARAQRGGGRS